MWLQAVAPLTTQWVLRVVSGVDEFALTLRRHPRAAYRDVVSRLQDETVKDQCGADLPANNRWKQTATNSTIKKAPTKYARGVVTSTGK